MQHEHEGRDVVLTFERERANHAEARVAELTHALTTYAVHRFNCRALALKPEPDETSQCDCGLRAALDATKAPHVGSR